VRSQSVLSLVYTARGTVDPLGRDAISSSGRGAPCRCRRRRPGCRPRSDRPPGPSFCRPAPWTLAPLSRCPARPDAKRETGGPDSFSSKATLRRRSLGAIASSCRRSNSSSEWPGTRPIDDLAAQLTLSWSRFMSRNCERTRDSAPPSVACRRRTWLRYCRTRSVPNGDQRAVLPRDARVSQPQALPLKP